MKQPKLKFPKQEKKAKPVFSLWGDCMRLAFEDHLPEIAAAGRDDKKLSEIMTKIVKRDAWYIFMNRRCYIVER